MYNCDIIIMVRYGNDYNTSRTLVNANTCTTRKIYASARKKTSGVPFLDEGLHLGEVYEIIMIVLSYPLCSFAPFLMSMRS